MAGWVRDQEVEALGLPVAFLWQGAGDRRPAAGTFRVRRRLSFMVS